MMEYGGVRKARATVGKKRKCDCESNAAWCLRSKESCTQLAVFTGEPACRHAGGPKTRR